MNLGSENETQEFKESLSQLDKGLKSLSAMLNRGYKGTVYFGVRDNGDVKGLSGVDIEKAKMNIRQRAQDYLLPQVKLDIDDLKDEAGKIYISVYAEGVDTPYSYDRRYYLRTASADENVEQNLLRRMFEQGGDALKEIVSETQSLTFKGTLGYLEEKGIHARDSKDFFDSFGFCTRNQKYNLLAYLLSDQNRTVTTVTRFAGVNKDVMRDRTAYSGQSLLRTVSDVLNFLTVMQLPKRVDLSAGNRREVSLFDLGSVREAWINACVHNSWREYIPPAVHIYNDRLEIISYGGLPYNLTQSEFYRGVSKPVNARLFEIFVACRLSEQSGYGVPTIISSYGKKAFSLEDGGRVVVTIPFNFPLEDMGSQMSKNAEPFAAMGSRLNLTPSQKNVLSYLARHPQTVLQKVADDCMLSLGEVRKITSQMKRLGALERLGAKNKPTWVVRAQF